MRPLFCYWVLCAALFAAPARAGGKVGDYRGLPADLAAAATAYDIAQFRSDRAGLDRWLARDYVMAGPDGRSQGKADLIRAMTAPGHKTLSVSLDIAVRKWWGDGAVLGGMVDARGLDRGKPTSLHARFVDVWARRGGRWQVVFTQMDDARWPACPGGISIRHISAARRQTKFSNGEVPPPASPVGVRNMLPPCHASQIHCHDPKSRQHSNYQPGGDV